MKYSPAQMLIRRSLKTKICYRKNKKWNKSCIVDVGLKADRQTDRQTDRQKFILSEIITHYEGNT